MWRPPAVKSASADLPVRLADAKAHLGVDHDDHNTLIEAMIAAAVAHVESVTGQRLAEQVLTIRCDDWSDLAALPVAPVASVVAITYTDSAGAVRALPEALYEPRLEGLQPQIVTATGANWPARLARSLITVEIEAGYTQGEAPPELLAAIKLILGDLYAYRETAGVAAAPIQTAATVEALLTNHRLFLI